MPISLNQKLIALFIGLFLSTSSLFSNLAGFVIIPKIFGVILISLLAVNFKNSNNNKILTSYYLFILWGTFTFLLNDKTQYGIEAIKTSIQVFIITYAIAKLIINKKQVEIILFVFILTPYIAMIINFTNFINVFNFSYSFIGVDRLSGTFGNSNGLATFGTLNALSSLLLLRLKEKRGFNLKNIIILVSYIISNLFVFYSGSKKGMIALILINFYFGYFFYVTYFKHTKLKYILIVIPFIFAGAIFEVITNSSYFERVQLMLAGKEFSTIERIKLAGLSWDLWTSNIYNFFLGIGYGNFRALNYFKLVSHNSFSEATVNTGLIGTIIYFSFYFFFIVKLLRLFQVRKLMPKYSYELIKLLFIIIITSLSFEVSTILFYSRFYFPYMAVITSLLYIIPLSHNEYSLRNR